MHASFESWQFYNVGVVYGIVTRIFGASCLISFSLYLPFSQLDSQFLMYFSEDKETKISKYLKKYVGISKIERIQMKNKLSERKIK